MIDLRSDTVTLPCDGMREAIAAAPLGDGGWWDAARRGEDPTVNALEDQAAALLGKEAAAFCNSGTMGNTVALLTHCRPGDLVLVDTHQHLYTRELGAFSSRLGQLQAVFYLEDALGNPDPEAIEQILGQQNIRLLCLEVSHNNRGGQCIPLPLLQTIYAIAKKHHVPVHMDGARLFNAAAAMAVPAAEIAACADSCMFCVSKGLGAPVGSLLCGSAKFIYQARETRRLLGGDMRQAGVLAAPALYALAHNLAQLQKDNAHAAYLAAQLQDLKNIRPPKQVDTNIVMLTCPPGLAERLSALLRERGVLSGAVDGQRVRLVFHLGISSADTNAVIAVLRQLDAMLCG